MQHQVVADDLVDLLLDRRATVGGVALDRGERGIVEHGLDVGARGCEGAQRVLLHRRRRAEPAACGSEHVPVHGDDVRDHAAGVPGLARRLVRPLVGWHGGDFRLEGVGVFPVTVGDLAHGVGSFLLRRESGEDRR